MTFRTRLSSRPTKFTNTNENCITAKLNGLSDKDDNKLVETIPSKVGRVCLNEMSVTSPFSEFHIDNIQALLCNVRPSSHNTNLFREICQLPFSETGNILITKKMKENRSRRGK